MEKMILNYSISSNTVGLSLIDYALNHPTSKYVLDAPNYDITFTIEEGVEVTSNDSYYPAIFTGWNRRSMWHPDVVLRIVNKGKIIGFFGENAMANSDIGRVGGTSIESGRFVFINNRSTGVITGGAGGNAFGIEGEQVYGESGIPSEDSVGGPPGYSFDGYKNVIWPEDMESRIVIGGTVKSDVR